MANYKQGNIWFVDSTGSLTTEPRQLIASIMFTTDNANDALVLRTSSTASDMISIKAATADNTTQYDFPIPLFFPAGIYVQTISSGAKAMLILASSGGGN